METPESQAQESHRLHCSLCSNLLSKVRFKQMSATQDVSYLTDEQLLEKVTQEYQGALRDALSLIL